MSDPLSFGPPSLLTTERLQLRPFTLDDAEALYAVARDPDVARYTSFNPHASVADSEAAIRRYMGQYAAEAPPTWAIAPRAGGPVIGTVGLFNWQPAQRRAEIGYMIARAHWGQGLAPEAVRAVLRFGFEARGLYRIEALVSAPNTASFRVLEKVGMRDEGLLRAYVWKNGAPHDMRMYALLAPEFAAGG